MLDMRTMIDEETTFYFAIVEPQNDKEEEMTGIIIDSPCFQQIMYCSVEEAEMFSKQLQKYIQMHKMRVNSPPANPKR